MTIYEPYINHQRTGTKFINYLQGFHIIAISKNTSKYDIFDSGYCKPTTFPKEIRQELFWSLANFFRIDMKNNSCRIAPKILSKKVKQAQQRRVRGTRVTMKPQKKPK